MTDHEKEIQELRRELARVKAERDAMVQALRTYTGCVSCAFKDMEEELEPCASCVSYGDIYSLNWCISQDLLKDYEKPTDKDELIRTLHLALYKVTEERDAAIEDIELLIHDDCMNVCDLCDHNPHGARCKEACAEAHWRGVQK